MKPVSWTTWAWLALFAGAYVGLGFWLRNDDAVEAWTYRLGLTAAAIVPVLFAVIYTVLGLRGSAKWWRNSIGTALVQAALTLVPIAGPLAWVFWADNGILHSSWLAWIEVSGPVVSALAWLRLCVIWLRVHHMMVPDPEEHDDASPAHR
jgi:hypothetical protein